MLPAFKHLHAKALKELPSGKTAQEQGLKFERLLNGDGRWSIKKMVDGTTIHRVLGLESEGWTLHLAWERLQEVIVKEREGSLRLPKGRKLQLNLEEAALKYLKNLEETDGKNLVKKRLQLERYILPLMGSLVLEQITTLDIQRYKSQRSKQTMPTGQLFTQATINRELATLSHLFKQAVAWGWIDREPCRIQKFKEEEFQASYLTELQAKQLLKAAKEDTNPQIYLFLLVALCTGMRQEEIASIKLADIDLERRVLSIPEAKAGRRLAPISKQLLEALQKEKMKAKLDQRFLFPSTSSASGYMGHPQVAYKRCLKRAGLPSTFRIHDLRHTAVSHLMQAGVDIGTIQAISGHKTVQMVMRYSHTARDLMNKAVDDLADRLVGEL